MGEGAAGFAYLLKDRIAESDQLARAIREVTAGGSLIDPRIARMILAARRELSRAQFVELDTKVQVLNASAALAFASGDLGQLLLTGRPIR